MMVFLYITLGRVSQTSDERVAAADPVFTQLPIIMPSPTPTNAVIIHEVVEGESLGSIAVQYGVDRAAIANANQISTNAILQLGQKLIIPNPAAALTPVAPSETPEVTASPMEDAAGAQLAEALGTATPTVIAVGGATIHTVAQGDTLQNIASLYGVAVDDIATANGISIDDVLSIGQELAIPGEVPPATETPAPTGEATTAVPTVTPQHHVVASGESLNYIAGQYDVSPEEVAAANGLSLSSVLSIGQVLTIPGPTPAESEAAAESAEAPTPTAEPPAEEQVHVVASGDTLRWIAAQYDVSLDALLARNDLTEQSVLSIGQEIIIPGETAALEAATPAATATPAPTDTPAAEAAAPDATEAPAGPVIYAVQSGDTLGAIAVRFGVDTDRIAEANDLTLYSILSVGQELVIPDVTPTPAPTAPPTPTPTGAPEADLGGAAADA